MPRAVTLGVENILISDILMTCGDLMPCLSCRGGKQYEGGADAAVERPHPHGEQGAGQVRGEVQRGQQQRDQHRHRHHAHLVQYSTVQYNTVRYSTVQCSTIQ